MCSQLAIVLAPGFRPAWLIAVTRGMSDTVRGVGKENSENFLNPLAGGEKWRGLGPRRGQRERGGLGGVRMMGIVRSRGADPKSGFR